MVCFTINIENDKLIKRKVHLQRAVQKYVE